MTVEIQLPVHAIVGSNLRWQASDLGLLTDLSSDGAARHLLRFQVNSNNGRAQVSIGLVAGASNVTSDADLSDNWEGADAAITVSAPGVADLVLKGPSHADNDSQDQTERYQWEPGSGGGSHTMSAWRTLFTDAYAADNSLRATITFFDGIDEFTGTNVEASFAAESGEPSLTVTPSTQTVVNRDASFAAVTGEPTLTATPSTQFVQHREASFAAESGEPTLTIAPSAQREVVAVITSGEPTLTITPDTGGYSVLREASFAAESGEPTFAVTPSVDGSTVRDASWSAESGEPTFTVTAVGAVVNRDASFMAMNSEALTNGDASWTAVTGEPTLTIVADAMAIVDRDASFSAESGS